MNTTTASHAFFLLFVMAIAVVIDSTSATEHADVRRRTKAAKGSNPTKVCLEVYNIQSSTALAVEGSYEVKNECGYRDPGVTGMEDAYNECLTEAGLRAYPFVFNRPFYVSDGEFQFVSDEKYSPCGFNKSAFKGSLLASDSVLSSVSLEYQADEFNGLNVAEIESIEYDFYCESTANTNCARSMTLSIYTRAPSSSSTVGSFDCRLIYRPPSTPVLPNDKWHTVRIVHDTVADFTFNGSGVYSGVCPGPDTLTLKDLADAYYVYGTGGTQAQAVGKEKIVFEWHMNSRPLVGYYDNIRIKLADEDFVRIYDF